MCFTQLDKCTEYSGPSYQGIGINQGVKQSEFNTRIASTLNEVVSKLNSCQCSGQSKINTDSTTLLSNAEYKQYTSSKCYNLITTRTASYSVVVDNFISDSLNFTYDVRNIISSLPQGIYLETCRVRLTRGNNIIANLSGVSSGIQLKLTEIPASARFEIVLNSTCGNIVLNKSVLITNEPVSVTIDFSIEDSGAQHNVKTQEEFNKMIYEEVMKVKSIAQTSDIQFLVDAINKLQAQVNSLQNS